MAMFQFHNIAGALCSLNLNILIKIQKPLLISIWESKSIYKDQT